MAGTASFSWIKGETSLGIKHQGKGEKVVAAFMAIFLASGHLSEFGV